MEKHIKHLALLRRMFSEDEWNRLLADESFTLHLREAGNTLDDVERLSILGEEIIHSPRVACDNTSTDPAKHGGPFKTISVEELESGVILNEECVVCGGKVRRVTLARKPGPPAPVT
jgi:hypothetical protein